MDTDRILIGIIILLVCITPVVILKMKTGLIKNKNLQALNNLAGQHQTVLTGYEHWNDSIIGIGEEGRFLFVLRKLKDRQQLKAYDLSLFDKCRVVNNNSKSPYKEGNFKVSDGIDLVLAGPGNYNERINMYNAETDGDLLTDELVLAEKWNRIINSHITRQVITVKT